MRRPALGLMPCTRGGAHAPDACGQLVQQLQLQLPQGRRRMHQLWMQPAVRREAGPGPGHAAGAAVVRVSSWLQTHEAAQEQASM